jgi:site-specific DNA recombinase
MQNRDGVIADCTQMRQMISDCTVLDEEIEKLTEEIEIVAEMVKSCVRENASSAQSQEEYKKVQFPGKTL